MVPLQTCAFTHVAINFAIMHQAFYKRKGKHLAGSRLQTYRSCVKECQIGH